MDFEQAPTDDAWVPFIHRPEWHDFPMPHEEASTSAMSIDFSHRQAQTLNILCAVVAAAEYSQRALQLTEEVHCGHSCAYHKSAFFKPDFGTHHHQSSDCCDAGHRHQSSELHGLGVAVAMPDA